MSTSLYELDKNDLLYKIGNERILNLKCEYHVSQTLWRDDPKKEGIENHL